MRLHFRRLGNEFRVFPGEGPLPPPNKLCRPDERRVIWIPAVPSSGTSVVAGVLAHLGVDMGETKTMNNARGYAMFEDIEVQMFVFSPNAPLDRLMNQRIRFRDYLNFRMWKNPTGRLGVKALATAWIWDEFLDPASLPVETLDVRRPVEDSIVADQERMAARTDRDPEELPATVWQHVGRSAGNAANWAAREMLYKFHPPKYSLEFYDLLKDPLKHIEGICGAFGLEPSDEQIDAALHFVKPQMRTV
jgi:hypothetical protein